MRHVLSRFSNYIEHLAHQYSVSAEYLAIIRVLFALHIIVRPVDYSWAASVPSAFFTPPPGIAWIFQDVPSPSFLTTLEFSQVLLGLALMLGYKTRLVSGSLSLVMMLGSSVVHSFSKIDHNILYELLPAFLAAAGWGTAYSLDSRKRNRNSSTSGFPILLWASVVAFALFTAGIPKALSGWLNPALEASRSYAAIDLANPVKVGPLAEYFFAYDQPWFWKFIDYTTVIAESWLVLAIFFPWLFRLGIAAALAFHAGVYLILGIDFGHYLFVYAVFLYAPVMATYTSFRKDKSTTLTKFNILSPSGHHS